MTKSAAPVGHATPATRVSLVNQLGSAVGISSQLLDGELECAARVALVEVIRQVAARNGLPAWPDPRSLSRDQLRPAAVQYGRPALIRIWPCSPRLRVPPRCYTCCRCPDGKGHARRRGSTSRRAAQWSPPRSHSTVGCGHEFGGVGRSCPHLRPRLERSRVRNCPVGLG